MSGAAVNQQVSKQAASPAPGRMSDRVSVWQPREAPVAESVAQYSRFVRVMKIALPSAAGFLLLLIVVLPFLRQENERFRIGTSLVKEDATTLSMTNARYFGTDDKGQPFNVTAAGVQQRLNDERTIDLVSPKAEMTFSSGTWLSASASAGVYDRNREELSLSGDVALFQHQGNEIHTTKATVRLKKGTASGDGQVRGQGPLGTIEAKGFRFVNDEKIIRFTGPARLTLNSKSQANSEPSPQKGAVAKP
jgi:lipopolysaccharide export system protein LptC